MKNSKTIIALMIGRGGSSLKDKNILPVFGKPLLHYTAAAARGSNYIDRFYISSDCEKILGAASQAGYQKIVRPEDLSRPDSQSPAVVRHALEQILRDGPADVIVVQHANVGTVTTKMIDDCINLLVDDDSLSAVVPSHEKMEYHPYRAKMMSQDGVLTPFFDFRGKKVSGNRQDLPVCVFFDHSIWVLDVEKAVLCESGQPPWPCMGNKIKAYLTHDCFDVHDLEDLKRTEEWISRNGVAIPQFA